MYSNPMFGFGKKKQTQAQPDSLTWDDQARAALAQSIKQAPVPKLLKGKVKQELKQAAEEVTRKDNRTQVTAQDLMAGMLSKMPTAMRSKVERAAQQGPQGLKNLEKELKKGE